MGNSGSTPNPSAGVACNGNTALCSMQYSSVSLIGAHDSAFVGKLPTQNQDLTVPAQLDAGIRFLQAQTHNLDNTLTMCHTSCLELDAGPLTNYLSSIKTWMDSNPDQVVTLLLTNGDRVPVTMFGAAMDSTGLSAYAYTPPHKLAISEWPTLQDLINANTRLVMFLDYLADTSVVPYINDEFSYFFETAFDVTDENFSSCALDRPAGSNGDGLMMIVNHFLDVEILPGVLVPNDALDTRTNAPTGAGSIGAQADLCKQTWGRKPNLILLDRFNRGNPFPAQNDLNGV